ncbi:hypothetical protein D3C73_1559960 [compost metagenome]
MIAGCQQLVTVKVVPADAVISCSDFFEEVLVIFIQQRVQKEATDPEVFRAFKVGACEVRQH